MLEFFEFLPQCCDAFQYLYEFVPPCADTGDCYNELRPMGSQYWFSWPAYLGWPAESLIVALWLMLALSVLLSTQAVFRLAMMGGCPLSAVACVPVFLLSAMIHGVFFWPVLFVALADAPAGILALWGSWCLILAQHSRRAWLWLLLSGLAWGCAAWVRLFYLYPLLIVLLAYVLAGLMMPPRRWAALAFLLALLPIAVQYSATWQRYHQFSFVSPEMSQGWSSRHLSDLAIGYDTVLPGKAYRWFSRCAALAGGLQAAFNRRDVSGVLCMAAHRLNFYWGSDARRVYFDVGSDANLAEYPERLDTYPVWVPAELMVQDNVAVAPDGQHTAERFSIELSGFTIGNQALFTGFWPPKPGYYTFSIWLWSPDNKAAEIAWVESDRNEFMHVQQVALGPEPQRFEVTGELRDTYHLALIGLPGRDDSTLGFMPEDVFYAWGAQIVEGEQALPYAQGQDPGYCRVWSPLLLGANILMALFACSVWGWPTLRTRNLFFVLLFAGLVLGQGLAIVPEQRFLVGFQVVMWCFGLLGVYIACCRGFSKCNALS